MTETLEMLRADLEAVWHERLLWIYDLYAVPPEGRKWPSAPEADEVVADFQFWFGPDDEQFALNAKLYEAATKLSDAAIDTRPPRAGQLP